MKFPNVAGKAVRFILVLVAGWLLCGSIVAQEPTEQTNSPDLPFPGFPRLETKASGNWWQVENNSLLVPRDEVVAFALYTHDAGTLKLSAQLYPLKPDEAMEVRLELQRDGQWREVARQPVIFPGWSAHFRIEDWDNTLDVPYRVRHGEQASFNGLIRRDPIDQNVIVVGSLSCNSK